MAKEIIYALCHHRRRSRYAATNPFSGPDALGGRAIGSGCCLCFCAHASGFAACYGRSGMARSAPTYAAVPGLIRKYFTIGQADFGGLYLFRDRASAQAWFNDAWRARVVATYGAQPTVTYFDVPLVVDNSVSR
jgi:Putative mono-oxygenase ydhR